FLVGLALMLGFLLPPLLQLKNVLAMRVMRRESGRPKGGMLAAYGCGFVTLAALLLWQAADLKLGLYVIGGFSAAVAAFVAVSWVMLRLASHPAVTRRVGSASLRYGLAQLRRHAAGNAVQTTCLALGLTALLLLTFTRHDLVQAWRRSVPADAPNRFLIGVQPDQREALAQFFSQHRMSAPELYPMVRARLTAVNGKPVREEDYTEERARRLIEREFNLSYMDAPPEHNTVSSGRWFTSAAAQELSVEEGIAERLGWKLGDELDRKSTRL